LRTKSGARHNQDSTASDHRDNTRKDHKIWESIVANYEMIKGAQLSNSFIILKVLDEANKPLNAGEISEIIVRNTDGRIFKVAGALRDTLEHRLRREGYVKGTDIPSMQGSKKRVRVSQYSITPKGKRLLQGWIGFISVY
jgi:DNA-binding PadR family transcriptional regulator